MHMALRKQAPKLCRPFHLTGHQDNPKTHTLNTKNLESTQRLDHCIDLCTLQYKWHIVELCNSTLVLLNISHHVAASQLNLYSDVTVQLA